MKLETAIEYMNADATALDPALREREVGSFAIDSREVRPGDVFFALSQPEYKNNGFNGDFEDSTVYVPNAIEGGATAVVVRRDRFAEHGLERSQDRIIFVDDAIAALQRLAHGVYLEWNKPVIAITGSAGKTTAKELTAHVLASSGLKVLRNIKNYNNGLGHPLTVLNLAADRTYDVAVLEMGMSTPMNEIRRLCEITPPDVAVELNVLPVHVEHLGSIENVARAKAELVEGMKPGGTAVLNADDPRVAAMSRLSRGKTVTFGIDHPADVMAEEIDGNSLGVTRFVLTWQGRRVAVNLPLNGRHNVLNALAASAVGLTFEMALEDVAEALSSVAAPSQRGVIYKFSQGFTVIDDSYNSNPAALLSMIDTMSEVGREAKRKIVVAGEMLELGPEEAAIHRSIGSRIGAGGIDLLVGVRGMAKDLVLGAGESGIAEAYFAEDSNAAAELVLELVRPGDIVLVKGSRGVRTERVVERLLEKFGSEGAASKQN